MESIRRLEVDGEPTQDQGPRRIVFHEPERAAPRREAEDGLHLSLQGRDDAQIRFAADDPPDIAPNDDGMSDLIVSTRQKTVVAPESMACWMAALASASLLACAPNLCGATHVAGVSQGTSGVSRTGRASGGPGVPKRLAVGLLRNKDRLGPFHMQLPSRETSFVCT